jgi:hypothetical protein
MEKKHRLGYIAIGLGTLIMLGLGTIALDPFNPKPPTLGSNAIIEDLTSKTKFNLTKVDGEPVKRIESHGWVNYVPYAIVKPGPRILTFVSEVKDDGPKWDIKLDIQPKARYKVIANPEGSPSVIKIEKNR